MEIKYFLRKVFSKSIIVYLVLALFVSLHLYLVYKTFIFDDNGNMKTAIAGYGDIPFHMTQISKFGFSSLFDFNEPLFSGERIRYAFFINWIGGILMKLTGSWTIALRLSSMIPLVAGYVFIFLTYRNILGKKWAALLAVMMFMLGSGLGAWDHIKEYWYPEVLNVREFVDYLVDNNISTVSWWKAEYPKQNINWGGAMPLVLLHQRAFFLGFFLFSFVLYVLTRFSNLDNKKWLWAAGIAFGLGPLGHYHTFLALSVVLGFYFLFSLGRKNFILAKNLFRIFLIAFIIALPQVIYLWGGHNPLAENNQSFMNFRLGWMVEPTIGSVKYSEDLIPNRLDKFIIYLKFLWINFGVILPLLGLSFLYRPLRKGLGFPVLWFAVLLFGFIQVVRTQPWDYDTNKILVYFGFFAFAAVMALLLKIIEKSRIVGIAALIFSFILIVFSGVVDILPRTFVPQDKMPVIFNKDAIKMADFIKQNTDSSDIIISSSTHLNVASSLAGRPTVVGYPGWLWTKGLPYGSREEELKRFYSDPIANKGIADKYGSHYILIDPTILYDWKADREVFDQNFNLLFRSGDYSLYLL